MQGNGPLHFDASLTDINFRTQLDIMERRVLGFSNTAVREVSKIDSAFASLGKLSVGAFAFTGLTDLPQQIFKVRAEYEQLEIALSTMLRSKSQADSLLKQAAQYAATTPFSVKEVATGVKQLLAYGFAAKETIPILSRLGDISAGLGLPLERLIYLYGTTKTQGRLFAQDLNQFVGSGIPLIKTLADQFGVAEDKVRGLVEQGKVGFPEVRKAIESLTSGSGLFAGTLDAQSKSLGALKERLGDTFEKVLNEIGSKNQDVIAGVLNTATDAVEHYQDFVDVLKVVALTYGTYKAAVLISSIAQSSNVAITSAQAIAQAQAANATGFLTLSQTRAAASTALLSRAQATLNTTILANPIALAVTAVAALVAYLVIFRKEVQEIKTAQQLLAESAGKVESSFNKQKSEVTALIGVVKNQNIAESERQKAYEKLVSISPQIVADLSFQQAKTADLTKATNEYLVSLRKRIQLESGQSKAKEAYDQQADAIDRVRLAQENLVKHANDNARVVVGVGDAKGPVFGRSGKQQAQADLDEAIKNREKTDKVVADIETSLSKIYSGTSTKEELQANIAQQERVLANTDKLSVGYKDAEDRITQYRKELTLVIAAEKERQVVQADTIDQIDAQIKAHKDLLGQQNTRAGANAIKAEIKRLEAQKRQIDGDLTKEEKQAAAREKREAAKSGPLGSIDYYTEISRKAQEAIEKTAKTNVTKLQELNATKLQADAQAEEIRKSIAIKSFDDELADKREKYELYQKFITAYGKETADAQFADLKKSGDSYLDYLNAQIAGLENERDNAGLSTSQTKDLGTLLTQRNDITGQKSALDAFTEGLDKAQASTSSLADYLVILKEKQDALTKNPKTADDFKARQEVAERIVQTQAQLTAQLNQYLADFAGSEQQQTATRKKYSDLRAELDMKYADNRGREYKAALSVIDSDEEKSILAFQRSQIEQTQEYKNTTKIIVAEGEKKLKAEIASQAALVARTKALYGEQSELYKEYLVKLNTLTKQDGGTGAQKLIGQYSFYIGEFGKALSQLGGEAGELGNTLTSVAGSLDLVAQSFNKNIDPAQRYAIIIQGVVGLLGALANASQQRKKAQDDFNQSLINQQTEQYNLLLKEQIDLQTKSRDNLFIRDYAQEIKDDLTNYNTALSEYQKSLQKLNEGKAKSGLKTEFDNKEALKLIATEAAAGNAIVPVIGGLVGGIVGGLTALFGGAFKKADEFGALLETYPDLLLKGKDGILQINTSLAESLIKENLVDEATKKLILTTIEWQKSVDEAKKAIQGVVKELVGGLGGDLRNSLVTAFEDGTSAADAFGKSVSKTLEDVLSNLLFNQVFAKEFKKLGDELEASFSTDGFISDDFQRFYAKAGELTKQFNDSLAAAQAEAAKAGLTIFKNPTGNTSSGPSTLGQGIQGVSESTANALQGHINAIRIQQVQNASILQSSLLALTRIAGSTETTAAYSRNLEYLGSIDRGIKELLSDPMRAKGL